MAELEPEERVIFVASLGALQIPAERRRELQRELRLRIRGITGKDELRLLRTTTASLTAVLHDLQGHLPSVRYAQIIEAVGCDQGPGCYPNLKQLRENIPLLERFLRLYPSGELSKLAKRTVRDFKKRLKRLEREELKSPPLFLESATASDNSIGIPVVGVTVTNSSQSAIDAFTVEIRCYDRFGRTVKRIRSNIYKGIVQPDDPVEAGGYHEPEWVLHGFGTATVFKVRIVDVHFVDGRKWRAPANQPAVEARR